MAYIKTLSGLGVDPVAAAMVTKVAPSVISAAKRMIGPFGFPKIHEFLDQVAREHGSEVVAAVYRAIPALAITRPTVEPPIGPEAMPTIGPQIAPEAMPIVAAGLAPGLGGATMPLLIAAGLALMFILKK